MAQWGDSDTLADAPKYLTPTVSFDGSNAAVAVIADDKIVIDDHGLETGDRVTYTASGAPVTGLTSGNMYYVIRSTEDEIKLAASYANAGAGTAITLSGQGAGVDTLQVTPHNESADHETVVFVDTTEAAVQSNKLKGLNTPGWNAYRTYTTGDGRTRHIVEPLVAMKRTGAAYSAGVAAGDDGITGDTAVEDVTVADS